MVCNNEIESFSNTLSQNPILSYRHFDFFYPVFDIKGKKLFYKIAYVGKKLDIKNFDLVRMMYRNVCNLLF